MYIIKRYNIIINKIIILGRDSYTKHLVGNDRHRFRSFGGAQRHYYYLYITMSVCYEHKNAYEMPKSVPV